MNKGNKNCDGGRRRAIDSYEEDQRCRWQPQTWLKKLTASDLDLHHRERKCADTTDTLLVSWLAISNAKI